MGRQIYLFYHKIVSTYIHIYDVASPYSHLHSRQRHLLRALRYSVYVYIGIQYFD